MCPLCIASAALIVGKITSASGAATFAITKFTGKSVAGDSLAPTPSKQSTELNAAREIVPNSN
jgi:hypothetical protein